MAVLYYPKSSSDSNSLVIDRDPLIIINKTLNCVLRLERGTNLSNHRTRALIVVTDVFYRGQYLSMETLMLIPMYGKPMRETPLYDLRYLR